MRVIDPILFLCTVPMALLAWFSRWLKCASLLGWLFCCQTWNNRDICDIEFTGETLQNVPENNGNLSNKLNWDENSPTMHYLLNSLMSYVLIHSFFRHSTYQRGRETFLLLTTYRLTVQIYAINNQNTTYYRFCFQSHVTGWNGRMHLLVLISRCRT